MQHPVIWFEVLGNDGAKLRRFYGEMFDWSFQVNDEADYGMVDCATGGIPGGVGAAPAGPGRTTFYVKVDDIDAAMARGKKLGAEVLMPVTELPDVTVAVLEDPQGNPIGLAKPRAK